MKGTDSLRDVLNRDAGRPRRPEGVAAGEAQSTEGPAEGPGVPGGGDDRAERKAPPVPDEIAAGGRRKPRGRWKIFAILGVGCLSLNLIVAAASFSLLAVGLSSCVASCSDSPIGDSREAAAFIADRAANERDLETFDALRPALDALTSRLSARDDEGESRLQTTDELRASLVAGRWPESDASDALDPQVWVRIAELSQDELLRETGERWEVVDFAYPFPDSGPVPVPATRDENSRTLTRLRCTSGADKGIYATVGYYRWVTPAYFESDLEEQRQAREERIALLDQLTGVDGLTGHDLLLDGRDLYVWEQGDEDPLRDPESFVGAARAATELMGDYAYVVLVARDMPVALGFDTLSSDYPNDRPVEFVGFDEGRERLLAGAYPLYLDHAAGDVLLSGYRPTDGELTVEDLRGTLSARARDDARVPAMKPDEASVWDEASVQVVAETLGVGPTGVIVVTEEEHKVYEESTVGFGEDSWSQWVLVTPGSVPETCDGFLAAATRLNDALWDQHPLEAGHRTSQAMRLYVVDDTTIRDPSGEARSFADLRAALAEDPTQLADWQLDVRLSVMPYSSLWEDETERHDMGLEPNDVGGSVARSRAWRYGS